MPDAATGRDALGDIDTVLAAKPARDGHRMSAAVRNLADFRDHYIERHRRDGGHQYRETLGHINAVISVVMAVEFPAGEVPWAELEKARDWLEAVLAAEAQ